VLNFRAILRATEEQRHDDFVCCRQALSIDAKQRDNATPYSDRGLSCLRQAPTDDDQVDHAALAAEERCQSRIFVRGMWRDGAQDSEAVLIPVSRTITAD
jgi:hypothetical protein